MQRQEDEPRGVCSRELRGGSRRSNRGHDSSKTRSQDWLCPILFLEEVLEGLTRVVVARRGRRGGRSSLLCVRCGCGVFLDRRAKFVERAVVLGVLGRDAVRNLLRALKLSAAVEEAALLATVQLKGALGTLTVRIKATGQNSAAIGAARARDGANHARRARAELIGARTALRRLAVMRAVFLILLFRVAIAAVIILSIHKRLRTPERAREITKEIARLWRSDGPACGRQAKSPPLQRYQLLSNRIATLDL
jgi:hypothetical protein